MPYIRLYSNATSLRAKRRIAGQLISIAQRSLELPDDERHSVTVQFLPPQVSRPDYCAVLEVAGQTIEPMKMVRFVGEVTPVLGSQFSQKGPLQRLFGIKDSRKLVAVEFHPVDSRQTTKIRDSRPFEVPNAA